MSEHYYCVPILWPDETCPKQPPPGVPFYRVYADKPKPGEVRPHDGCDHYMGLGICTSAKYGRLSPPEKSPNTAEGKGT